MSHDLYGKLELELMELSQWQLPHCETPCLSISISLFLNHAERPNCFLWPLAQISHLLAYFFLPSLLFISLSHLFVADFNLLSTLVCHRL